MIGVGNISAQYFASLPSLPNLRLVAVADLDMVRAAEVAAEQGVEARTVDELLASDDVDAVLNLTIPAVHVEVGTRVLESGKHVYAEKPLALRPSDAAPMLALAAERGLRVGSAPDTVLGTGIQTARRLIDDGAIGQVLTADAHWSAPGHERWHPNPAFYYQPGGGPLLDMGPYYLTALVTMLGPVVRVSGVSIRSPRERSVATGPKAGEAIPVAVDTGVSGILEHASGAVSRVSFSFDTWATRAPLFEVHGTTGSIAVPDPNRFDDPVEVVDRRRGGVAHGPAERRLRRRGPRLRPGRHGARDRDGPPAPRLRRPGAARARDHGRDPALERRARGDHPDDDGRAPGSRPGGRDARHLVMLFTEKGSAGAAPRPYP